jgi:hypothetical protein
VLLQVKDGDKLDRKALMQEALSERLKEAQVRSFACMPSLACSGQVALLACFAC